MDNEVKILPLDIDQISTKDLVIYLELALSYNKLQELVEGLKESLRLRTNSLVEKGDLEQLLPPELLPPF